jgi:hypothetical protein
LFVASLLAAAEPTPVRIQNFREIPLGFEAATNFSSRSAGPQNYYNLNFTRFPQLGQIEELTPSALMATVGYGGFFCQGMIDADALLPTNERWAHMAIDFNAAPSALTVAQRQSLIEAYSGLFWQRSPSAEEMTILSDAITEFISVFPNQQSSLKQVLLSVCAVYSSSFEFMRVR